MKEYAGAEPTKMFWPIYLLSRQSENEYIVNGNGDLVDFFEKFDIKLDIGEEYTSNSIGGFVCEYLGLLPNKGASFIFKNLKLEILDIYRHRIQNIKVTILPPKKEDNE